VWYSILDSRCWILDKKRVKGKGEKVQGSRNNTPHAQRATVFSPLSSLLYSLHALCSTASGMAEGYLSPFAFCLYPIFLRQGTIIDMTEFSQQIAGALHNNTHWEQIQINRHRFFIRRVSDPEKLLEAVTPAEFDKDEYLPYWAEIWPAAHALSVFIDENSGQFEGKNILELGCGLGLAGITATACGANVLFTDYDHFALDFTRESFRRNFRRAATVEYMDWRQPVPGRSFEMIIAADVLYEKRWIEPLISVIQRCLEPKGMLYMAEPNRSVAKEFFRRIRQLNWAAQSWLKQAQIDNKFYSVTIHRISKC
jgi:predicted nicotinamide N-methyase